ncbi:transposase [Acetobacter pasteurianus NBRC 101655]|nr:transposase [Acetobacter pasteurianus NBRC 101655]
MKYGMPRSLTLAQQFFGLKNEIICAGKGKLCKSGLTWQYSVTPTPLSRQYKIRIDYSQNASPKVYVEDPDLVFLADGREIPHIYSKKPLRLCLYLPDSGEWKRSFFIHRTIVPWTTLWLFYFEEWLISDDWKGGGKHFRDKK